MIRRAIVQTVMAGAVLIGLAACSDSYDPARRSPEGLTVGVGGGLSVGAANRSSR